MSSALLSQLPGSESRRPSVAEAPDASDARSGLHCNEFQAYEQPKFDLKSQTLQCVEVLVRWQHPLRGLPSPATFIALMTREHLLEAHIVQPCPAAYHSAKCREGASPSETSPVSLFLKMFLMVLKTIERRQSSGATTRFWPV
ncbi:hypothetical protein J2Y88_004306 [Pseudomonas chlororaphis]|uniref:EAL domain-containing protein n=1 Tax=Pseudomonas chlororaphis TaxID=587753 RepID=UPI00209F20EE|nr:EAL domain-containing protein [Pseudomonas chlororaphis]MCP1481995.1 hypothetical protein [Pseudomonas chlororaphis]MCP1597646.1 hypothetical protein [Pseudomonas chlororaphis]